MLNMRRPNSKKIDTLRYDSDPPTFAEFKWTRPTKPADRAAAMFIQKVIDNRFIGNHFNRMKWTILSPPSAYPFLTCDRLVIMTNGMGRSDSHLALPIGPRKLFIASNGDDVADLIAARKPDELVSFVNDRIVNSTVS